MFHSILVVLDGSKQDEGVVPFARKLARKVDAELVLMRAVLAKVNGAVGAAEGRVSAITSAEEYVSAIEESLRDDGLKVRSVVPYGPPAEVVLENAVLHGVDAIVMACGASAGDSQSPYGLAAHAVLRRARIPVLVLPALAGSVGIETDGQLARCHNCGRMFGHTAFRAEDRCPRCSYYLRACPNCASYDGMMCGLDNPQCQDRYAGTSCEDFQFRGGKDPLRSAC